MNVYNYSYALTEPDKKGRAKKKLRHLLVKADNISDAQNIAETYVKNRLNEKHTLTLKDVRSFI